MNDEVSSYKSGIWAREGDTGMLTMEGQDGVEFSIQDFETIHSSGGSRGIELINTSDGVVFEGCKFIYSTYYP